MNLTCSDSRGLKPERTLRRRQIHAAIPECSANGMAAFWVSLERGYRSCSCKIAQPK